MRVCNPKHAAWLQRQLELKHCNHLFPFGKRSRYKLTLTFTMHGYIHCSRLHGGEPMAIKGLVGGGGGGGRTEAYSACICHKQSLVKDITNFS